MVESSSRATRDGSPHAERSFLDRDGDDDDGDATQALKDQTVSVIMPAFNEGHHIHENLLETARLFERARCSFEIIAVDDGSDDNSREEITRASAEDSRIKGVFLRRNCGKGRALQVGFEHSNGEYVVFLDSDLDLHPRQLVGMFRVMRDMNADVVAGSKRHPRSTINYPKRRKIISLIYYLILWGLFNLPLHDTQAGLKIFRRRALKQTLPYLLCKRYALDVELLANIHHLNYRICEAPVNLQFRRQQKWGRIRLKDLYATGIDTLAIFYRLHLLRYYDRLRDGSILPESTSADVAEITPRPLAMPEPMEDYPAGALAAAEHVALVKQ